MISEHPIWAPLFKAFLKDLVESGPSTGREIAGRLGWCWGRSKESYKISGCLNEATDEGYVDWAMDVVRDGWSIVTINAKGLEYLRRNEAKQQVK